MKFYEFLIFVFVDAIIHYFLVKWEVRINKDLFVDLELRPMFSFRKKLEDEKK